MISPKGFCREDEPSFEPSLNQLGLGPRRIFVRTGNKHIVSHLSLLHVHVTVSKYIDGTFEQLPPSSALQILSKLLSSKHIYFVVIFVAFEPSADDHSSCCIKPWWVNVHYFLYLCFLLMLHHDQPSPRDSWPIWNRGGCAYWFYQQHLMRLIWIQLNIDAGPMQTIKYDANVWE